MVILDPRNFREISRIKYMIFISMQQKYIINLTQKKLIEI